MLPPVHSIIACSAHRKHESVTHTQLNITMYEDTVVFSGVKVASVVLGTGSSRMVTSATYVSDVHELLPLAVASAPCES
jgi:hypothetical protein